MKNAKRGRLVAPAMMIILGTGLAAAVAAAQGWQAAILIEAVAAVGAIGNYVWGGRDSDMGAMFGSRVDERQSLLRMRAQSLAAVAVAITAVVGTMVATALKDPDLALRALRGRRKHRLHRRPGDLPSAQHPLGNPFPGVTTARS